VYLALVALRPILISGFRSRRSVHRPTLDAYLPRFITEA
jgi:hypothetical protein